MANWYIAMNNLGVGKGKHSGFSAQDEGLIFKQLTFDAIHYRIAI